MTDRDLHSGSAGSGETDSSLQESRSGDTGPRGEAHAVQLATVLTLARVAEFKNQVHPGHLKRINRLSEEIARDMLRLGAYPDELDADMVEKIGLASILHDVGMVSVPDHILDRNNQLLEWEELELIRNHATIGHEILQAGAESLPERSFLSIGADIARAHHERYDGSGYPVGLSGKDIPLAARIVAIADVFDALITERGYKRAWPVEDAVRWVTERAGTDFDPLAVQAFQTAIVRILAEEPDWAPQQSSQRPSLANEVLSSLRSLMDRFIGSSASVG